MRWSSFLLGGTLLAILFPSGAQSQTLIAQYYRCDTAYEQEADFLVNTAFSLVLERHEAAGEIDGWGWVQHAAGGPWRRIFTITAPDRTAALNSWAEINQELQDEHPSATHRFNEICGSHDDYLWNLEASSEGTDPGSTPNAWLSAYFVCNEAQESRADELQAHIATVYDARIAAGEISGWSWYSHDLGGRFRRLLTVSGTDFPSILDSRDGAISDLQGQHAEAMAEFGSICTSHVDYLWQNGRTNR